MFKIIRSWFFLWIVFVPLSLVAKTYDAIKGESQLIYELDHPLHHVIGVSRDFFCRVELSPDTVTSQIKVSAPVSSFDSKSSSRDSHAMELVQARKFPKVEFVSESIKPEGGGYFVLGRLTFHGQTKPVSFHVTPKIGKEKVEITGSFSVKLSDFGIARPRLLFIPAEDKLTVRFDLFSKLE